MALLPLAPIFPLFKSEAYVSVPADSLGGDGLLEPFICSFQGGHTNKCALSTLAPLLISLNSGLGANRQT